VFYFSNLLEHKIYLYSLFVMKRIQGVGNIKDGYNPATWILEVTTSSKEIELGVDFAEVYTNSTLYRYLPLLKV